MTQNVWLGGVLFHNHECMFVSVDVGVCILTVTYISLIYMLSYNLTASIMSLQQPATLSFLKLQVGDLSNMHLAAGFVVKHEWKHHFNAGPRHSKGKHLERHSDWGVSQKTCFPPLVSILGLWSTSRCFQSNHLWSFRKGGEGRVGGVMKYSWSKLHVLEWMFLRGEVGNIVQNSRKICTAGKGKAVTWWWLILKLFFPTWKLLLSCHMHLNS